MEGTNTYYAIFGDKIASIFHNNNIHIPDSPAEMEEAILDILPTKIKFTTESG